MSGPKGYKADQEGLETLRKGLQGVEKELRATATEVMQEAVSVPKGAFGGLPVSTRVANAHLQCATEVQQSANQSGDDLVTLDTKVKDSAKEYDRVEVEGVKALRPS